MSQRLKVVRIAVHRILCAVTSLSATFSSPLCLFAAEPGQKPFAGLAEDYLGQTRVLMKQFCLDCHSTPEPAGDLNLDQFATLAEVRKGTKAWVKVAEMLDNGEMPPQDSDQPTPDERKALRGWVERYLHAEALANAGDPGPVVLRRLNNAEYTYTVRDLTGVNLDPAREFPADGAAGEGFNNAGNALGMSPALVTKYFDAGKEIAQHVVLLPDGFRFSSHTTQRDWTDEILAQIRDFYRKFVDTADLGTGAGVGNLNVHGDTRLGQAGRLPLEKYLAATLAERNALTTGGKTIEVVARERGLNAKYLGILWSGLSGSNQSLLIEGLRGRWRSAKPEDAAALAAEIAAWQRGLWTFGPVGILGRQGGPSRWMEPVSPLVTHQDIRFKIPKPANGEKKEEVVFSLIATDAGDGNEHDYVVWQRPRLIAEGQPDILLRDVAEMGGLDPSLFGKHPNGKAIDPDSLCIQAPSQIVIRLPVDLAAGREFFTSAALDAETGAEGSAQPTVITGTPAPTAGLLPSEIIVTFSEVSQVFSSQRAISFSQPILVAKDSSARKRIESALDEYRSVFPAALCYTQIVPVDEVLTVTPFYREDDHLTRLMLDDPQKAQLNRLWKELHFVSQSALLEVSALEALFETFLGNGVADRSQYDAVKPLQEPLNERAAVFRKELIDAEPKQIKALVAFAGQAYRRPLTDEEASKLKELYRRLRKEELPHDEAFRLTLARIFVSSPFLYRLESIPAGKEAVPVSDWELANRLSYFLWSSQPDHELRLAAADGALHLPEVLAKQTRRMLADPRVRRLASEFACQWLHIHDFGSLEVKSEKYFPEFAELRGDMQEESILFFTDLFQHDASLLDLLNADHTFVNERLAKFYGIPGITGPEWRRTEGMRQQGRGGILGLSTTLAKQSGTSRTSPILRGNWVSEVLLGEKLPRPPKTVPALADDIPEGLTERQLIEKHRSDASCGKCHKRIDPFGFALEGFDAIGRRRDVDLAGRPIDTKTKLPDGSEIDGLAGLRDYLMGTRREAILRGFCRKLLGYALGREVQLSDQPLLTEMQKRLADNNYRFSVAVEMIVESRQFRDIRGKDDQYANLR